MLKRPHYIALAIVAMAALVLLNLPSQTAERLKLVVGSVFVPLFGLAGSAQKLGESAGIRAIPKTTLIRELESLRRENRELRLQLMQAQELARENAVLREALDWSQRTPWKTRLVRVVTRDPANWWRSIQINAGSRMGIVEDLPVVTKDGLIGRVSEVGYNFSRVMLLGDPNCKVSALVNNEARETGMLVPGPGSILDESIVRLTYLPRQSKAQPGQKVTTSGLGGIFPKGIPIGTIIDTNQVEYGLYLEARVKLAADLRELEEVFVIFP